MVRSLADRTFQLRHEELQQARIVADMEQEAAAKRITELEKRIAESITELQSALESADAALDADAARQVVQAAQSAMNMDSMPVDSSGMRGARSDQVLGCK